MRQRLFTKVSILITFAFCISVLGAKPAAAQTEAVIHSFQGNSVTDGAMPTGGLVADKNGALYGTTLSGGKYHGGTVFKLAPPTVQGGAWKQNILYAFTGGSTNAGPWGTLVLDPKSGKLYGGTSCSGCAEVFELSPPADSGLPWTETVIYNSTANEISSLISDGKGRLYGTTITGGRNKAGSVFVISFLGGAWKGQDLYSFQLNGGGAVYPSGLILSTAGVLYGVTGYGGGINSSAGTVFSLTPPLTGHGSWTEADLYVFSGGADGSLPIGSLAMDESGALYGTAMGPNGNVFQLSPPSQSGGAWTFGVLYSFQGAGDGAQPASGVIFDSSGALYGTTQFGGDFSCSYDGVALGCGVVFELLPPTVQGGAWTDETLHAFGGGADGIDPEQAPLLLIGTILYGTTLEGGDGGPTYCGASFCGTVFSIN